MEIWARLVLELSETPDLEECQDVEDILGITILDVGYVMLPYEWDIIFSAADGTVLSL